MASPCPESRTAIIALRIYFREQSSPVSLLAGSRRCRTTQDSRRPCAVRHLGIYTARVRKGIKPADQPVIQSMTFERVIIIKTANALGLAILPGVPAMADFIHILFSPKIPQCGIAR
jgi:hypothetical protein